MTKIILAIGDHVVLPADAYFLEVTHLASSGLEFMVSHTPREDRRPWVVNDSYAAGFKAGYEHGYNTCADLDDIDKCR